MISLEDFMRCIGYRVTGGGDYGWRCYGPFAHRLDSETNDFAVGTVFDTETQLVYEIEAWDHKQERIYRWIHPDYIKAIKKEYKKRGLDFNKATEERNYIELDVEEDIIEKATAIAAGQPYDDRVIISMDIDDETLALIARGAHALDITINQFIVKALEEVVAVGGKCD